MFFRDGVNLCKFFEEVLIHTYAKIMQNTKYEQTLVTVFKALPAMPQ